MRIEGFKNSIGETWDNFALPKDAGIPMIVTRAITDGATMGTLAASIRALMLNESDKAVLIPLAITFMAETLSAIQRIPVEIVEE